MGRQERKIFLRINDAQSSIILSTGLILFFYERIQYLFSVFCFSKMRKQYKFLRETFSFLHNKIDPLSSFISHFIIRLFKSMLLCLSYSLDHTHTCTWFSSRYHLVLLFLSSGLHFLPHLFRWNHNQMMTSLRKIVRTVHYPPLKLHSMLLLFFVCECVVVSYLLFRQK